MSEQVPPRALEDEEEAALDSLTSPSISDNEDGVLSAPLKDNIHLQVVHPGICNGKVPFDFPDGLKDLPPWSPARRILTFMGMVCLACTLLVVGIVLVAVYLSHSVPSRIPRQPAFQIIYAIPQPRWNKNSESQTIEVNRRDRLVGQVEELRKLFADYQLQGPCPVCGHAAQLDSGSQGNCSRSSNFGYDTGSPCVALVFQSSPGFEPVPFSNHSVPEMIQSEYNPDLVYVTCSTGASIEVRYWPRHGYPVSWFPRRNQPPPFIMLQFVQLPSRRLLTVSCSLWAKNIPRVETDPELPGKFSFNLLMD